MKHTFKISIIAFILLILASCSQKPLAYTYVDGNNNVYKITEAKKLIYDPITPEMSSSGIYSGGDPAEVQLTDIQYTKITGMLFKAYNNSKIHMENRTKGNGMVKLIYAADKMEYKNLNNAKAEVKVIEELLKEYLGK